MYMNVKAIAFRILQKVYTACVWEYRKQNQEDILSQQYIYMDSFIVMMLAL